MQTDTLYIVEPANQIHCGYYTQGQTNTLLQQVILPFHWLAGTEISEGRRKGISLSLRCSN